MQLGPVGTDRILALAESTGLSDELNRWILHRAARDAVGWVRATHPGFFVAVNASPAELESPHLVANIADALRRSGLSPSNLFVELSERVVVPDEGGAAYADNLRRIGDLGVRLMLDDFGEGRTSLAYLRGLPISGLKIDRVLVKNSVRSAADRIILESVNQLAHELSLFVVAEGIETDEQLTLVVDSGADLLQGYYLHRPVPADELTALLARQADRPDPASVPAPTANSVGAGT